MRNLFLVGIVVLACVAVSLFALGIFNPDRGRKNARADRLEQKSKLVCVWTQGGRNAHLVVNHEVSVGGAVTPKTRIYPVLAACGRVFTVTDMSSGKVHHGSLKDAADAGKFPCPDCVDALREFQTFPELRR